MNAIQYAPVIPRPTSSTDYWIGLTKATGNWMWSDGNTLLYTSWDSSISEPNGSGDCGRISNNDLWRDMSCASKYNFICEKGTVM
jgi:hypothetical protein